MKYLKCAKYKQKNLLENFVFVSSLIFFMGYGFTLTAQYKPFDNGDLRTLNKKELQSDNYFRLTKNGPYKSISFNTILRYGIQKNFELQVTWTGNKSETFFGDKSNDVASVGLKTFLFDDSKYLPGITLIGNINLTADPKVSPIMPSLNIVYEKKLGKFALNGNYQFLLNEQSGDLSSNYSVNLESKLTRWLVGYIGLIGTKSYGLKNESALYQEYIELGLLIWVADGITFYPYYDLGLGNDSGDILNLGMLYFFK